VHVALSGTARAGRHTFWYLLDHVLRRRGSARLTFTDVVPGRHQLVVFLASSRTVRATTIFHVNAPPPPPAPAPAPMTAPPAAPAPAPAPAPMSSGGIPQGNGGDMDSDNNGGPSDGDGGI
jgi:hypothetical protein